MSQNCYLHKTLFIFEWWDLHLSATLSLDPEDRGFFFRVISVNYVVQREATLNIYLLRLASLSRNSESGFPYNNGSIRENTIKYPIFRVPIP